MIYGTKLASFQRPALLPSLAVCKSGREPGIIFHMSDVEGRKEVERTYLNTDRSSMYIMTVHIAMFWLWFSHSGIFSFFNNEHGEGLSIA